MKYTERGIFMALAVLLIVSNCLAKTFCQFVRKTLPFPSLQDL